MYHSELVGLGPVRIAIKSEPKKSKYPDKPAYVAMEVQGVMRNYNCENPGIEAWLRGQNGKVFQVLAEGRDADATLTYLGEPGTNVPPPGQARTAPPPPNGSSAAPAQPATQRGAAPPPAAAVPPDKSLLAMKVFVGQNLALVKIACKAAHAFSVEWKAAHKEEMSEEMFRDVMKMLLFRTHDHPSFGQNFPYHINYPELQVVGKQATAAAPKPEPPKCQKEIQGGGTCGLVLVDGKCPECDRPKEEEAPNPGF